VGHESANSYTIDTAAKLAGAAAIVNGLINENCKIYTGAEVLSADVWNNSSYVNNATGPKANAIALRMITVSGVDSFNGKTLYFTQDLDMVPETTCPSAVSNLMTLNDTTTKISRLFQRHIDGQDIRSISSATVTPTII
jgi:hypothetical protein